VSEGPHIRGRLGGVVYATGRKRIFQCAFQDDKGKEVRISTKTTDQSKALAFLEQRRRDVIKAQETGEIFEAPKLRRKSIGECLDAWATQCKLQNKWNDCYASDLKSLKLRWGSMRADQVTKSAIQSWQLEEKQGLDEKRSLARNAKLNRHLGILTRSMKIAGITPTYQAQMADLRLREPEPRQGFFEPYQFRILLASLPEHIADAVLCLYLTGWRRSEVIGKVILGKYRPGVLWSEKQGDNLLLPAERNKGRRRKLIPATGELLALIQKRERLRVEGSDLIFHRGDGRPIGEFDAKWEKACIAAGRPGALVHDLRRSRARNWVRAGVSEAVAQQLGGWATRSIFQRYDIVSEDDLRAAQERTEQYLLQKETEKQAEAKQISTAVN
jgi:integrase